jgi:hypothetical protein
MALGNSDRMSCGPTYCPHVDALRISTGPFLPSVPLNKPSVLGLKADIVV